jgi:hypothetical protein
MTTVAQRREQLQTRQTQHIIAFVLTYQMCVRNSVMGVVASVCMREKMVGN